MYEKTCLSVIIIHFSVEKGIIIFASA